MNYFSQFIILFLFLVFSSSVISMDSVFMQDGVGEDIAYEEGGFIIPENTILAGIGYGGAGLCFNAGYRYTNYSLQLGLSGIANDIPNYTLRDRINANKDPYTDKQNHEALILSLDGGYHYNIDKFTLFGNLGYFWQTDTVLARRTDGVDDNLHLLGTETESGVCFGLGAYYYISDMVDLGLGFHSKHGVYATAAIIIE